MNSILESTGTRNLIEIQQAKYLNNILEKDHPADDGFKAFHSASAIIAGIEVAYMIHKKQFANDNRSPFQIFVDLAA
ncbi:hypothetical protein [Paenochrobactrum pullorum]|uniref:hypothetical protein n=1 Tax=Paenochrobactrum pullorum TaxID=1324351 RepID=UPI0035BC7AAD